jgi:uncharacterized membrane protein
MADIFLSYASEDRQRVEPLVTRLEEHGWDVWWDREIPPGETWPDVLERVLAQTNVVVVVWTRASIRSDWVKTEASEGRKKEGLFPVALDDVLPPLEFRLIQAADLTQWDGSSLHSQFQLLVRQIEGVLRHDAANGETTKPKEPTAAAPVRPNRRLESIAPTPPRRLDFGPAESGTAWPGEPCTVAIAPGILNDGTFCVVAIRRSNPEREYLIEPQIRTEAEARRLADAYRERCTTPGLLTQEGSIPFLNRKYETPVFLHGRSEEDLKVDLHNHLKEVIGSISGFKLKTLYQTSLVWSLASLIVFAFDWHLVLPDWVPFGQQILGSNSLGRVQLAAVLPTVMAGKLLFDRYQSQDISTKYAIASEIVTTLACAKRWSPDRFRDFYGREIFSSSVRGFVRRLAEGSDEEIKRFNKAIGDRATGSPFDHERETFERDIHALTFHRRDTDYSAQKMRIDALLVAGDFQSAQLEHRLTFLGPREARELRYRVRTAVERGAPTWARFVSYLLISPVIMALLWALWLSWPLNRIVFALNLVLATSIAFALVRMPRAPSVPPELFSYQLLLKNEMTYWAKLTRRVPRSARPVAVEVLESVESRSGSDRAAT